jgi:DNA-binding winged helix-turn-helix (wHTH) protein/Tol biopolymer transport system component
MGSAALPADRTFRFGPFELSVRDGQLRKNGNRIRLQEQPFQVLVELLVNAGRVVTREQLQQKLWPADTFVDFDVGLNTAIRKIRQALGDDAEEPRYIETLARRGYRFVVPVNDYPVAAGPVSTGPSTVISATGQPNNAGPVGVVDSLHSTTTRSLDHGSDSKSAIPIKRPWYFVLAASCALALVIYGALVARRGAPSTTHFATEQRITANPAEAPVTAAVVSPDGKYVVYADTTGTYVRHIDTGETRPLQLPKAFSGGPTGWFPDSTNLLLTSGVAQGTPALWKVSILGGDPQKLIENAEGGAVAPDGSRIAFMRGGPPTGRQLWVADADGSNPRAIAAAAGPEESGHAGSWMTNRLYRGLWISRLSWSTNGRRIAFIRRFGTASPNPAEENYSLETVDSNGGEPHVIARSAQLSPALCWADGRLLYAYRDDPASERSDFGVWSVRVNEKSGEREGNPLQLTKGVGRIGGLSVTADSKRLVVWRANTQPQVFLTEIDPRTHGLKIPRRLTLDENANIVSAWTPDSRAVLFVSNRNGTWKLFRQAIDQVTPQVLVEGRDIFLPRLNPDGNQILYLAEYNPEDSSRPVSVMRVPLQGGSPQMVLQKLFLFNIQCARSPSRRCLLNTVSGSTTQLFWFDPEDGKTHEFVSFHENDFPNWSLSPDGSQLALVSMGSSKITFMDVNSKVAHEVELKQWPHLTAIDWAAGGESVFVEGLAPNGAPVVLDVEPAGNHRVLLEGDKQTQFWWIIPSPDGRYAALEEVTGENNVWMIENF